MTESYNIIVRGTVDEVFEIAAPTQEMAEHEAIRTYVQKHKHVFMPEVHSLQSAKTWEPLKPIASHPCAEKHDMEFIGQRGPEVGIFRCLRCGEVRS